MKTVAVLCDPSKQYGCPQVGVDEEAPQEKRVVLTDDFGGKVQMSASQFGTLTKLAREGKLDNVGS